MRTAKILLVVVSVIVIGISTYANDIVGTYAVTGSNPGGKGQYKGTVIITKTKDTYKLVWSVGAAYIGTGILVDNVLSVAYTDENKKWFGIVAYKVIDSGKKLEGNWCAHGGQVLGTETLEKK